MAGQNIAESATKVTVWLQRRLAMGEGLQEKPLPIGQPHEPVVKSELGKADGFVLVDGPITEEFEELTMQNVAKTRTSPRDAIEQLLRGFDDCDYDSSCSEIQREEAEMVMESDNEIKQEEAVVAMESDDEITMAELDAEELDEREGGDYEDVEGECYSHPSVEVTEVRADAEQLDTDITMGESEDAEKIGKVHCSSSPSSIKEESRDTEKSHQLDTSLPPQSANGKETEADVDSAVEQLDQLVLAPVMPGAFEPQEPQRMLRAGPPPFINAHDEGDNEWNDDELSLPAPVTHATSRGSTRVLKLRKARREKEEKLRENQEAPLTDVRGGGMVGARYFQNWQTCPSQDTQLVAIPMSTLPILEGGQAGPSQAQSNAKQSGQESLNNLEANHAHLAHLRTQPKPWPAPNWAHVTTFVGAYSNLPENTHLQTSSCFTVSRQVFHLLCEIDGIGSIHRAGLVFQTSIQPLASVGDGSLTPSFTMGGMEMVGGDIWANMLQVERDIWWWKHRLNEVRIRTEETQEAGYNALHPVKKWEAGEKLKVLRMVGEYISGEAERWRLANGVTKGVFAVM